MSRLTRWQWARRRVGQAWLAELAIGVAAGALTFLAGRASELASVGIGILALLLFTLLALGWHFSRAEIEQDRLDLHVLREEEEKSRSLQLDIWIVSVRWRPFGGEAPGTAPGYNVLFPQVQITNRSRTDRVSLSFSATVGLKSTSGRLNLHRGDGEQLLKASPIAIGPQETWNGALSFQLLPVFAMVGSGPPKVGEEAVAFDSLEIQIEDHVSGKMMSVPGRRSTAPKQ